MSEELTVHWEGLVSNRVLLWGVSKTQRRSTSGRLRVRKSIRRKLHLSQD